MGLVLSTLIKSGSFIFRSKGFKATTVQREGGRETGKKERRGGRVKIKTYTQSENKQSRFNMYI
jgi:hypothetical protein